MWYILFRDRRPLVQALGSTAVLALLLAGCSGNQATAKAAPAGGKAEPKAPAAAAPAQVIPVKPAEANKDVVPVEGPIPLEPPDGKWLTDEYGRKYFVHKIAKVPQAWAWVEEGKKVQLVRGLQFDVVSYDDRSFDVKIYGTDAKMASDIAASVKKTSPEDLEKAAATYKADVPSSDRLLLTPFSQGLPQHGQWRQGFVVADVNGDGHPDIVHGPPRKGGSTPAIFLGDGKGHWRRWAEAAFPAIPFDYGNVAVADFNGDGKADLALASHLRGITVLVGDGKGGFTPWSQGIDFEGGDQDKPVFTSRAIAAVDWNADGRPDLLAWGEGPRLATARVEGGGGADFSRGSRGALLYVNQGDGTWQKQLAAVQDQSYGDALVVTDFDKDGKPDFAAASALTGNRTLLYLHQPDGSWKGVPSEALRPQATFRGVTAG
ncbi:MAG: FG-GAP repeat domain-containing protein, partial [Thermoanaerobaculia bacterium]